jgi:hypothetical protein
MDTAAKRYAAITPMIPGRVALPIPDGTIAQADRQTIALMYSGILASSGFTYVPRLLLLGVG